MFFIYCSVSPIIENLIKGAACRSVLPNPERFAPRCFQAPSGFSVGSPQPRAVSTENLRPEIFQNGDFTLEKESNVFRPQYAGKVKNAIITVHFRFVLEKNSVNEITWLS